MTGCKVSIVLVTYNQAEFITKAIESILSQKTNFLYEIIIHDDASTDGTSDIVRSYSAKYPHKIKCVVQAENKYSRGIRIFSLACSYATSPLVAICEGDDYWIDDLKLQKQYDYMLKNKQCGAVFSDANIFFEANRLLVTSVDKQRNYYPPTGDVRRSLLLGNPYKTCTVMFRKDVFLNYVEHAVKTRAKMDDYVAWLTISMTHEIGYIPEALATYRVLPSSASHFTDWRSKVKFDQSAYKVSIYFNKIMGALIDKEKIKAQYSYSLFIFFIRSRMPLKALSYFKCTPYYFILVYASLQRSLNRKNSSSK